MPFYTWLVVIIPAAVGTVGIVVFFSQYRAHRTAAVIGLVIAMCAALSTCPTLLFLGGRFAFSAPVAHKNALGGFPFPYGTTWVYSRVEYAQAIGDPTQILTATSVVTETIGAMPSNAPSYTFMLERTVSNIHEPDGWWGGSPVKAGEYWYRIRGNQVLSIHSPESQNGSLLYDFPLAADKSWCPQEILPDNLPSCHMNGLRTVENRTSYTTPAGTFDECYEISEEYNSGGVWEWFCDGVGTVARRYDHGGTAFGFQDTLVGFIRGAGAP
jgi:hypothetical protein